VCFRKVACRRKCQPVEERRGSVNPFLEKKSWSCQRERKEGRIPLLQKEKKKCIGLDIPPPEKTPDFHGKRRKKSQKVNKQSQVEKVPPSKGVVLNRP